MICRLIKIWSWISFAWSLDHSFQGSWSLDFMQKKNGSHASSDSVDLEFILIQLQNTLWSKLQMFLQMICNWQPFIIWISLAKSFMIGSNFESNYLLCSGHEQEERHPSVGQDFTMEWGRTHERSLCNKACTFYSLYLVSGLPTSFKTIRWLLCTSPWWGRTITLFHPCFF